MKKSVSAWRENEQERHSVALQAPFPAHFAREQTGIGRRSHLPKPLTPADSTSGGRAASLTPWTTPCQAAQGAELLLFLGD